MINVISKYRKAALALGLGAALMLGGCTDKFMTELNTDTTKPSKVDPGYQLSFALLSTYGSFNSMEVVRSYVAPYTQMYGGSWNSANAGGANYYDVSVSQSMWNTHYKNGIKNLVDAEYNITDDDALLAAVKIHKVYLFQVLTDIYGDIPVINAGKAYYESIFCPEYDEQQQIYSFLFDELDEAISLLENVEVSASLMSADVTSMGGNPQMWLRYANSLKMRLAMRISDADPALAKTKFQEAAKNALASSESAYVNYMHVPFRFGASNDDNDFRANAFAEIIYGQDKTQPTGFGMTLYEMMKEEEDPRLHCYCRFLNENFRDNTDPSIGREDFTEEVLAAEYDGDPKTKGVQMIPACWAWYDQGTTDAGKFEWPNSDCVTKSEHYARFIQGREGQVISDYPTKTVRGSVATDYVLPETPGMLLSGAEVAFLKAEAALKGWISGDAEGYYHEGIRAAILSVHNGVYAKSIFIPESESDDYVASHPLSKDKEKAKEQINTQSYFLHFANPLECWANLRRSDYPRLFNRAQFGPGQNGWKDPDGGMELNQPVRMYYPQEEINYNKINFLSSLVRQFGSEDGFSWHKRMWWDTKEQNYREFHLK